MKPLTYVIIFICLLRVHKTVAASLNQIQSVSLDCSKFKNDYDILASLVFKVPLNPLLQDRQITYGLMDLNDHIYYLNIFNKNSIPLTIFCFKHLKEFYIRRASFSNSNGKLPIEIEHFASTLTHLGIFDTTITHLPEQLGKLTQLRSLEISNTGLEILPDCIGNLLLLNFLYLPNNKLTSLPMTIINTQSLWQIVLNNNPDLRSIQSINGHPYLKYLATDNCPIEKIPINLPQLTNLYMSNNNLTNLVDIRTLGNETNNEKYFYFYMNFIQFIPPQIQFVNNLHTLNVNHNKLEELPSNIFNISTLRYLYIRHNNFTERELKKIITKFKITNPSLTLVYLSKKITLVKYQ